MNLDYIIEFVKILTPVILGGVITIWINNLNNSSQLRMSVKLDGLNKCFEVVDEYLDEVNDFIVELENRELDGPSLIKHLFSYHKLTRKFYKQMKLSACYFNDNQMEYDSLRLKINNIIASANDDPPKMQNLILENMNSLKDNLLNIEELIDTERKKILGINI